MSKIFRRAILMISSLAAIAGAQEQWLTMPSPTTKVLYGTYFTSPSTGYVVGDSGKIYKTSDGANTWTFQPSGVVTQLRAVRFADANNGYVVGSSGIILKTTNGGNSWVLKPSGTTDELNALSCPTISTCYVVRRDTKYLQKTTNGGTSWTTDSTPTLNYSIHFLDSVTGWLGGYYAIYKTTNGGASWAQQPFVSFSGFVTGIHMVNSEVGYATENFGNVQRTSDGVNWQFSASGASNDSRAIFAPNASTVYMANSGSGVLKSSNGGVNWTNVASAQVYDVHFANLDTGYAVGNGVRKHVHTPPATPAPSTPANSATNTGLALNLVWSVVPYTSTYRVQLSTDALFSSTVLDDSTLLSATTYLENLSTSTTYYWRVNAKNPGGTSAWSTTRSFSTVPPIPTAPDLSLPASGATNASLNPTLSWSASSGAATYRVQLSTSPSFSSFVKDTTQATTSKAISPVLSNNTTYYWRVSATNAGGTSAYSTTFSFTTAPVPSAPNLSSPGQGAVNIPVSPTLTWDASANALTYRVQLSTDSLFATTLVNDSTVATTSRAVGPLSNNTKYYWRVNAKNGGTSAFSTTFAFTTLPAVPVTPTLSSPASAATNIAVSTNLTWGTVSGAATYRVQLSTDSLFASALVDDSSLTSATKAVGPLSVSTAYYWRVNAKNAGGTSAWSTFRKFTTVPAIPGVPVPSSPAQAATDIPISTNLVWQTSSGAATYAVQLATDSLFTLTVVVDSSLTATTRAVGPLANLTAYYWRVNAKNPGGTSTWSATQRFTTAAVAVPPLSSPTNNAANIPVSTTLAWSASTAATSYALQVSTDSTFLTLAINELASVAVTRAVGPLNPGTLYYWRVRATTPGGVSAWSTAWKFTTMTLPSAPQLASPAADTLGVPVSTTLSWLASAGAATYRLQLSADSTFATTTVNDSTLTGLSRAAGPLLNSTTYYWRMNAKNGGGTSAYSPTRRFVTVAPTSITREGLGLQATGIGGGDALTFRLAIATGVRIRLHDAKGVLIARLMDGVQDAGPHIVTVPEAIPSGLYFLDFQAGKYRQILKLVR